MRITDMEVAPVAHREPPLRNPWGAHSETAARTVLRLTTAEDEVGVAETYGDDAVIGALERERGLVEGMDPYERRPLELRLQDPMAAEYADAETEVGRSDWLPNKPRW